VLARAHLRTLEEKAVLLAGFKVLNVKLTDDRRALDRVAGANRAASSGNARRTGEKSAGTGLDEN
jgi:hypothetical protein